MTVDPQLLALLQRWHMTKTNYDGAQRAQEAGAVALVEAERALASWLAQRGVVLNAGVAYAQPPPPHVWPQPPPPAPPYPYPPYTAGPPPPVGPPPHPAYAPQHVAPVNEEDAGEVVLREMRDQLGGPNPDGMYNGPIT